MTDARFEDAPLSDRPVKLLAEDQDDLGVLSALVQDAVCKTSGIHWMPRRRALALILHRFRWEDRAAAEAAGRPYERVQTALEIGEALAIRTRGIDQAAPHGVQSLLAISFEPEEAEAAGGTLMLTFSGDAAIAVTVECLSLRLGDLTRPWEAQSREAPDHSD